MKVDEFPVSLNKCSSLRVKCEGSYGFSIECIVTSCSLVDRCQSFTFFCSMNLRNKYFNSGDTSRHFFEKMMLVYENIRTQFTVRRCHIISEDGNLSKFEKRTQLCPQWRMDETVWYAALSQIADLFWYQINHRMMGFLTRIVACCWRCMIIPTTNVSRKFL
jgi:hypothetical protein